MTDAVAIQVTVSAAAVLVAGTGVLSAWLAYKSKTASEHTHKAVNSRLSSILKMVKKDSYAAGKSDAIRDAKGKITLDRKRKAH